jgi:hypothetical protein
MEGPILQWVNYRGDEVDEPPDAQDWRKIVKNAGSIATWARFMWNEQGAWIVLRADQPRIFTGAVWRSDEVAPIDVTADVKAALIAAGKPIQP